jgi:rubrerythrin
MIKIEKKLYLKAEKIFHTNAGLALYSGDSVIFLPRLSVDHMGYYLSCGHRLDDYYFICPKPKCGTTWWFSETWSDLCPVCGTPGE